MQQEKEDFYNMVKETGELFIFFDEMTGNWGEDKVKFCSKYDDVVGSAYDLKLPVEGLLLKKNDNLPYDSNRDKK